MAFFKRRKHEIEFDDDIGHGRLDIQTDDKDFTPGFDDPDIGAGRTPSSNLKKVLVIGIPIMLVCFGVLIWFGWDLVSELTGRNVVSRQKSDDIGITDDEWIKLLQQRDELAERLKTLEDERGDLMFKAEQLVKSMLSGYEPSELKKQLSESEVRMKEMAGVQIELLNSIARLQEQLNMRETEPVYPEAPPAGSKAPSILFSSLPEWKERIANTEQKMQEKAMEKPPYTIARGIKSGIFLDGILRTSLISSTYTDRMRAVVELAVPYQVEAGMWLPAGTVFMGTAISDLENTRRMHLEVDEMRVGDITMPIKGIVLQKGNPGLVSKYIDPLNNAAWSSLLPNMLAAAADAAQDMVTTTNMVTGDIVRQPEFSEKNIALQGLGNSMRLQSQIMLEVQARKKPVIIVNRNLPVQIQILETIPIEILMETGVLISF